MYGLYGLKHHILEISGDVTDAGHTNERTREDRATQPLDAGRLSFAKSSFGDLIKVRSIVLQMT